MNTVQPGTTIVVGFWRRFVADVLDAIVLAVIGWAIAYPFRYALSELGTRAAWIGLAVSLLYAGVLQTRFGQGQTFGKRVLGIQVLRRDGSYLGMPASLTRYLVVSFVFYNGMYGSLFTSISARFADVFGAVFLVTVLWVFLACFSMIPLHPLKRGLHDLVSGSIVVTKGSYDPAALAQREDPQRARRLIALISVLAVLMCGAAFLSFRKLTAHVDMARLTSLQTELAKHYEVIEVKDTTFNGAHRTLNVVVWVPLRIQENPVERERARAAILAQTRAATARLEDFETVRIWISSGFKLGIANMNIRD